MRRLARLQKVIRPTVYLCPENMLLSNTLIDSDTRSHLGNRTLCSSSNPSTICQQKYGLPTASEDRHEYLCLLKADRRAQLPTWQTWFPHLSCIGVETPANSEWILRSDCRGRPPTLHPPPHRDPRVAQKPVGWSHPRHGGVWWGGKEGAMRWKASFSFLSVAPSRFSGTESET